MREEKIHEKKRKFFKSKNGFFAALAFCLVAVGIATFGTIENLSEEKARLNTTESTLQNKITVPPTQAIEDYFTTEAELTVAAPTAEPTSDTATQDTTSKPQDTGYISPLDNAVSTPFSNGALVYSKTMRDYRVHNGIDIEGTDGEEVRCFASGEVSQLMNSSLYGKTVVIDHGNDLYSYYCGVEASVKEGDNVEQGQVIGTLCEVSCESLDESHIHFCVQKSGEWIDPQSLINL